VRDRNWSLWRAHRLGDRRNRHVHAGACLPGAGGEAPRHRFRRLRLRQGRLRRLCGIPLGLRLLDRQRAGNTFYWVLITATLGRFFPAIFGDGTTAIAIIVSLIGVWAFHFMILRGVEQATFINTVVTIAKIVPLIVAILAFIFFFNYAHFSENFFGGL